MQVVNSFGDLVDDVPLVLVSKHVFPDQGVEIDVHILEEYVDVFFVLRTDDLLKLHHVRMLKFLQKHYFPVGALGVSRVLKGIEVFLEGIGLARLSVEDLPDHPISPTPYLFDDFVSFGDVRFDFIVL